MSRLGVAVFLVVLGAGIACGPTLAEAHHAQPDVLGAVYAAAQRYGVPAEPLIALTICESHGDAHAESDRRWIAGRFIPTSRGAAMLNDLPTGLAHHFWSIGYTDREDPEQSADYLARVSSGEFLPGQPHAPPLHPSGVVSLARWTCGRLLGLS